METWYSILLPFFFFLRFEAIKNFCEKLSIEDGGVALENGESFRLRFYFNVNGMKMEEIDRAFFIIAREIR